MNMQSQQADTFRMVRNWLNNVKCEVVKVFTDNFTIWGFTHELSRLFMRICLLACISM